MIVSATGVACGMGAMHKNLGRKVERAMAAEAQRDPSELERDPAAVRQRMLAARDYAVKALLDPKNKAFLDHA